MHPADEHDHIDAAMRQWEAAGVTDGLDVMALVLRLDHVHSLASGRIRTLHVEHGLAAGDFDVLATLYRHRPERLAPSALADALLQSRSGMTGRLNRLEKAGLLSRRPSEADGRGQLVGLTEAGVTTLRRALPRHLALEEELLAGLDAQERATLDGLLRTLLRHLHRADG